ncbi:MAG: DUF2380 domain-containing protein [Methylococcales bacterium]|nr:DUF2380 domain-containing protein [Methylococcales bacterium]
MKILHQYILSTAFTIFFIYSNVTNAETNIAILDFELNDITSLPHTPKEIVRTTSIKPLLEQAMLQLGEYKIIGISIDEQKSENPGFGYLFKFHDVAARLGKKFNADWIIIGQHSKPSFLYSYLMAHLVNVKTGQLVARYDIELKGNHQKVTKRGIKKLSMKIDNLINKIKKEEK